jgi:hypothetical protein
MFHADPSYRAPVATSEGWEAKGAGVASLPSRAVAARRQPSVREVGVSGPESGRVRHDDGVSESEFEETRRHWWLRVLWIPLLIAILGAGVVLYVNRDKLGSPLGCSSSKNGSRTGYGPDRARLSPDPYDFAPQPSFNVERDNPDYGDERMFTLVKGGQLHRPRTVGARARGAHRQ